MSLRIPSNGAITKLSSSASRAIAKTAARTVIDLTQDSDEESGQGSGYEEGGEAEADSDEYVEEEEESDVKSEGTKASEDEHIPSGRSSRAAPPMPTRLEILRQQPDRPLQSEYILEDTFVVTSTYHLPWDSPDNHTTLGVYNKEPEAMQAAQKHYNSDQIQRSDGWESRWRRDSANIFVLHGEVDNGEDESETCEVMI